ncbi:hypothetical protein BLNAU_11578 [Blattamonas nauphoetae]|uniref:Uncharacterized protein n=1 Tax=Blattamonas nauphoetae TaxID=2049346 RepID=A0ABQ9XPI7_9EUKA|nr:hypothetical protein BLNAU_11578 [Blattamonas nauphoetae]
MFGSILSVVCSLVSGQFHSLGSLSGQSIQGIAGGIPSLDGKMNGPRGSQLTGIGGGMQGLEQPGGLSGMEGANMQGISGGRRPSCYIGEPGTYCSSPFGAQSSGRPSRQDACTESENAPLNAYLDRDCCMMVSIPEYARRSKEIMCSF